MTATVYFSRTITPEKVLELYKMAGKTLPGMVAVKVHSGKKGNQNFLRPDFWNRVICHLLEWIESRNGVHTIEAAAQLGYGSRTYTLVEVG